MILGSPQEPMSVRRHYELAREVLDGATSLAWMDSKDDRESMMLRDRHMSQEIRRILAETSPRSLVHVSGYEHLAPPPGSLRGLLEPESPCVCLLADFG